MSFDENFTCDHQPVFGNSMNFSFPTYGTSVEVNMFGSESNQMESEYDMNVNMDMYVDNESSSGFVEETLEVTNDIIHSKRHNRNRPSRPRPHKSRKYKNNKDDDGYGFFRHMFTEDDNYNDGDSDNGEDECNNPLCDHKYYRKGEERIDHSKSPPVSINDITDLIKLGKTYHCKKNKVYYGINLRILSNLVPPLSQLEGLVGMKSVKQNLVNQIVFFLQGFNQKDRCGDCVDCNYGLPCPKNLSNDMLHTVITGPPGVGKTELGKILGKVYKAMGVLSRGHVKVVSRSDLVGKYLGHTAAKTQAVIDECSGGVMFIDEAYALGNSEGRDSFSKECIDTINQNLTERRDFLCIIAGYKDALDNCFFNYNEGLRRRFTFRYDIEAYSPSELKDIFKLKVNKEGWSSEYEVKEGDSPENVMRKHELEQKVTSFFDQNMESFPHYGGDVETFFFNCKIVHGKRVMFLKPEDKKVLTEEDIEMGFNEYISCRKYKETDERKKHELNRSMFY